jgi:glycosyltransferase involved in cell wall biosynthesis
MVLQHLSGQSVIDVTENGTRSLVDCPVVSLSLVVPVFNEEQSAGLLIERVKQVFDPIASIRLELIFINDGSHDDTLRRLLQLQQTHSWIVVADLSRNFGKEAALSAGLRVASGRVVVVIDVDLQDPPELILEMIDRWRSGDDVVVGRRVRRDSDSFAKKNAATWFYRIHNWLSEVKIPENVGDFRLMDRAVVDALLEMPESCRFMKGMFAWVGFNTGYVDYERPKRAAGSSKFTGWKLWNFALQGITSFSTAPLRIWTYVGVLFAGLSLGWGGYIFLRTMIKGIDVPGYASLLVAIMFLGGIQLIGIGVLGEYLGRVYIESKRRPIYVVRKVYRTRGEQRGESPPLVETSSWAS